MKIIITNFKYSLFLFLALNTIGCSEEKLAINDEFQGLWVFDFKETSKLLGTIPKVKENPSLGASILERSKEISLDIKEGELIYTYVDSNGSAIDPPFVESFTILKPRTFAHALPDGLSKNFILVSLYDEPVLKEEVKLKKQSDYTGFDKNIKLYSIYSNEDSLYLNEYSLFFNSGKPESFRQEYIVYKKPEGVIP